MRTSTAQTNSAADDPRSEQSTAISSVNFDKFVSSSSAVLFVRVSAAAFSYFMTVVVTRVLGGHEAGIFFLGQTFLVLLAAGSRFGLDNVLVRYVSTSNDQGKPGGANAVLLKAALVTAPLSLATAAVVYSCAEWIAESLLTQPDFTPVLRSVAICLVPFAFFQLFSFALQGSKHFVWSMIINTTLFPLALLIAASFPGIFGVDSASSLMMIAVLVSLFNALLAAGVWLSKTGFSLERKSVRWQPIWAMAFPLFCITIVSYANTWAPQLVLARYADAEQIAILSISQKTAALVTLLILPINAVASPTFAAMFQRQEQDAMRKFLRRVNGTILVACGPILLVVFIFAPQILSLFGPQFTEAKWVLRILVLGQVFNAASGSLGYLLMMSGNERALRNGTAVSAVAGIALSFALIPSLGTYGAAIAVAGVLAIYNILIWAIVHQRLGVNVFKPDVAFVWKYIRGLVSSG